MRFQYPGPNPTRDYPWWVQVLGLVADLLCDYMPNRKVALWFNDFVFDVESKYR